MQKIANEMNLSETAFIVPKPSIHDGYDLRWFTLTVEVDLCGHATLASGHVVLNKLNIGLERVTFHTRSGALGVETRNGLLELDLPSNPPTVVTESDEISAVSAALGSTPSEVLHANTTVAVFEKESDVAALRPDFAAVAQLEYPWLAATALADKPEYDFISRFFVPTAGVNEDPATGSSHTILMPYWSKRLRRDKLIGRQISARGGTMYCELADDRVKIAGNVVEIMTSELNFKL